MIAYNINIIYVTGKFMCVVNKNVHIWPICTIFISSVVGLI